MPDPEIDVALGAALIAKDAYPSLDPSSLLAQFDEMASPLFSLRLEEKSPVEQARVLSEHVYETLGFRGNEADYYDPRNSLLSDVLERKLGIPITLAVVYCGDRSEGRGAGARCGVPRALPRPRRFARALRRAGARHQSVLQRACAR